MKTRKLLSFLLLFSMLVTSLVLPSFADGELSAAATEVIEMIMALDENAKPGQLAAVKEAYNALTPDEKTSVFNYDTFVEFEKQYALAVNDAISALKPIEIDLFSGESVVKPLVAKYEVLGDEAKALVTEYEKLEELNAKIDALRAWADNVDVCTLNSTMQGLARYDLNSLVEA